MLGLLLLLLVATSGGIHAAPPANDDFAQAESLSGTAGTLGSDNLEATLESLEPVHGAVTGLVGSAWWSISFPYTAQVTLNTAASTFDTVLAVYEGADLQTLAEVVSNDDTGGTSQSQVTFTAASGVTYFVAVAGARDERGRIVLNWDSCPDPLAAPANPVPADGESTSTLISVLDWDDVPGATEYEVFYDGTSVGRTATSSISLGGAERGAPHEWQVVAYDRCTSAVGPLWRYDDSCSIPPPAPANPQPAPGATVETTLSKLDWDDVPGALSYDVELDGVSFGNTPVSEITLPPGTLSDAAHSWQVTVRTACGNTVGPLWRFRACDPQPAAGGPIPSDGETTRCALALLDWEDAPGAVSYDVYVDGTLQANVSDSQMALGAQTGGAHTWQVVTVGNCLTTTGPVWNFCLLDVPAAPIPADGETTVCAAVDLDWEDVCGATSYEVYSDSALIATVSTSDFTLTSPLAGGSHTWQIVARNDCGSVPGPVWTYCTMDTPAQPSPADGETTSCGLQKFDWEDVCGALSYDVLLDGATVAAGIPISEYMHPVPLSPEQHTWQVRPTGACTQGRGPLWSFCLLNAPAVAGEPADGATIVAPPSFFDWADVCGATTYTLELDGAVAAVTTESQVLLGSPAGVGTHTWRVIAENGCAAERGPLWSFTVPCPAPGAPGNPLPLDGETTDCLLRQLVWDTVTDATGYRVLIDGSEVALTSASAYALNGSLAGGSHDWQVVALNDCGEETTGPLWTFCLMDAPTPEIPLDGATTGCVLVTFDWSDACGATTYTLFIDGVAYDSVSTSDYVLTTPLSSGNHRWYVAGEGAGCGTRVSPESGFCTQDTPVNPLPASGETTGCALSRLEWEPVCGADSYEVTLDGVALGVVTTASIDLVVPLSPGYHDWQVTAVGCTRTTGGRWNFCLLDAPSGPQPLDGEALSTSPVRLDWADTCGATTYSITLDGSAIGETTESELTLAEPLPGPGSHTWRVRALNDCSTADGPEWTFTVACPGPAPARGPVPADGATTACALAELAWEPVPGVSSYRVLIDGAEVGTTTGTAHALASTLPSGVHVWQLVTVNECGSETTGPLWAFCLLDTPADPLPWDGETTTCQIPLLQFGETCGATGYEIFLDGVSQGVSTSPSLVLGGALSGGAHTWSVDALSTCGRTSGPTWRFWTLDTAKVPSPGNGETTSCMLALLDWEDVCGARSYDVYVDGTLTSAGLGLSELLVETPLGGGRHTWEVVTHGASASTTSPLWTVCLLDAPSLALSPLDGSVLGSSPIFFDWDDGCGATTYTLLLDGTPVATTTESEALLPPDSAGIGVHQWSVRSENDCGMTDGPVWTFTVVCPVPTVPMNPIPGDGVTTGCGLSLLDWSDSRNANGYRVFLDGAEVQVTSSSEYLPGPLMFGRHEWQIVALNNCGEETTGPVWTFCLLDSPTLVSPAAGETTDCAEVQFDWLPSCGAAVYELYVDGVLTTSTVETDYLLTGSLAGGSHVWSVRALGASCGDASASGGFCVQGTPILPTPANQETTACGLSLLEWQPVCGADYYEVYVDGLVAGTVTSSSLPLASALTPGSHEWSVVAYGCSVTSSPLWTVCLLDTPSRPTPANGAVLPSSTDTFDWADTCGATTYTLIVDGVVTGTTTVSQYLLPSGPVPDGQHIWQVVAENECGQTLGPEWIFYAGCASITPPSNPVPPDGSTTGSAISQVSWDPVPGATAYRIYFNGSFAASTANTYAGVSLSPGTYTWQIRAVTPCGEISGPTWTFTVCDPIGTATQLTPDNGVTTTTENIFFDWTDVPGAAAYLLLLDNTAFGYLTESHYQFLYGINPGYHEWRVVATNGCGFTTSTVRSFCAIRPPDPVDPLPGSVQCVSPGVLDWHDVPSAVEYDVYIDEVLVSAGQSESRYVLPSSLAEGAHTWRIVARNDCGEISGPQWEITISSAQSGPRQNVWMTNGSVYAMAVSGNVVYLGGSFTRVGAADGRNWVVRQNLAAVDLSTGMATDWRADTDAPVRALVCDNGVLYAGGEFDRIGGIFRSRLAAVEGTSGTVLGLNPGANGQVDALAVSGSRLYVGGRFTTFGGQARRYAAAVDTGTGAVTPWAPNPNSHIRALAAVDANILVGGNFSNINGQARNGFAAVDPNTGALTSWGTGVDFYVYSVIADNSRVYIGGLFFNVAGQQRRNLAAFDRASGALLPWAPRTNGAVNALACAGNSVYAGGLFSTIAGLPRPYMSALSASNGEAPNCGYDPDYPIHCLAVAGNSICAGGDFTYIGTATKRGFAVFGGSSPPPSGVREWEGY